MKSLTRNGKFLNYFPLFISLKMIIIKRTRFIDEEIYIMNKVSKGLVLALAGITVGTSTGLSTTFFQSTSVAYAAEMTKEKNDLANRYIADYLGNCQQYEQNDKTFKGFSSIKDITYSRDNKIKIDVNDDIYQLPKARRSLLIQDLQNGVYGTLADNDLKKLSEKDIQKGCPTTVYLNGKVIGHTAKNDNQDLQNGVYGTLADNDLKKLSEKDIQKGCPTTVYLNGKVIGHTAKNDNHHIIWNK